MPDELPCEECFPPITKGEKGFLFFDGERLKWSSPPVDGRVPVWSDSLGDLVWVDPANLCGGVIPAGTPKERGPAPRKLPDLDEQQPM
jgi:hypothetical protein